MKIEDQVVSLELSKKLKELGVERDSLFAWKPFYSITDDKYIDWDGKFTVQYDPLTYSTGQEVFKPWYQKYQELESLKIPAYTASELGEILPPNIEIQGKLHWLECKKEFLFNAEKTPRFVVEYYCSENPDWGHITERTEADGRALMFIYLIQNNLLSPKTLKV